MGIVTSAPEYPLDVVGDTNLATGSVYRIGGTPVLSSTALGTTVTSSSITTLGDLASLTVSGSFTSQSTVAFTGTSAAFTVAGPTTVSNALTATDNVTFSGTTATLTVSGTSNLTTLNASGNVALTGATAPFTVAGPTTIANNLTVNGDFTVNGNTTYINATTLQVDDKNIELGIDTTTLSTLDGGGITLGALSIGATRPIFEYTYNTGDDYWKSNIGIRGVGTTLYSAFEKDGTVKVANIDGTGDYVAVNNQAINFSQKWRLYCDTAQDKMLLQHYESDAWTTKFTFAAD